MFFLFWSLDLDHRVNFFFFFFFFSHLSSLSLFFSFLFPFYFFHLALVFHLVATSSSCCFELLPHCLILLPQHVVLSHCLIIISCHATSLLLCHVASSRCFVTLPRCLLMLLRCFVTLPHCLVTLPPHVVSSHCLVASSCCFVASLHYLIALSHCHVISLPLFSALLLRLTTSKYLLTPPSPPIYCLDALLPHCLVFIGTSLLPPLLQGGACSLEKWAL